MEPDVFAPLCCRSYKALVLQISPRPSQFNRSENSHVPSYSSPTPPGEVVRRRFFSTRLELRSIVPVNLRPWWPVWHTLATFARRPAAACQAKQRAWHWRLRDGRGATTPLACLQNRRSLRQLGESHAGELRRESAEARAERIIAEELQRQGWTAAQMRARRKSDPDKLALAARLRRETTLAVGWIAQRLGLGTKKCATTRLQEWKRADRRNG